MGSYDGGGKMGHNSTQTGAGGPQGTGGASRGSNRTGAAAAGQAAAQRTYRGLPNTPMAGGAPRQYTETGYGAPVRTDEKYGVRTALPQQATPGKSAMSWGAWKDQMDTYNQGASKWNKSAEKPSFQNFLNNAHPFGFAMEPPDLNRPGTYTGGDYHLGVNPAELAGSLASIGTGVPGLGTALGGAYTMGGGHNLVLSGPDVPGGWDPNGAAPANPNTQGPTSQMAGRGTQGGTQIPQPSIQGPLSLGLQAQKPAIPGPIQPTIFPKPPTFSQYNVPGGNPYSVNLFGRAA